jgi:hypothetical protein
LESKNVQKSREKFLEARRVPAHLRNEHDIQNRTENQSVVIFEVRPEWKNPVNKIELPIAKATYVKSQKVWKVYWQRRDLKWHSYPPSPVVKYFKEFWT